MPPLTYANSCAFLARCSKSIIKVWSLPTKEELMAKVWCNESYARIIDNLNQL